MITKRLKKKNKFEKIDVNLFESMANKIVKEDDFKNRNIYMNSDDNFDMDYVKECINNDKSREKRPKGK